MTSFHYNYQNALRQAIVFSIFSFVKNRSCVTKICITKIAAKCILVVVVKLRHHANVLSFQKFTKCAKVCGLPLPPPLIMCFGCWVTGQTNSYHMSSDSNTPGSVLVCKAHVVQRVSLKDVNNEYIFSWVIMTLLTLFGSSASTAHILLLRPSHFW